MDGSGRQMLPDQSQDKTNWILSSLNSMISTASIGDPPKGALFIDGHTSLSRDQTASRNGYPPFGSQWIEVSHLVRSPCRRRDAVASYANLERMWRLDIIKAMLDLLETYRTSAEGRRRSHGSNRAGS